VLSVVLMGLFVISIEQSSINSSFPFLQLELIFEVLTNGRPQYVHQLIFGLSTLMKILGCPRGPPPPSQATTRSFVQRTGCLWIRSIAAYGRGYIISSAIAPYSQSVHRPLIPSPNPRNPSNHTIAHHIPDPPESSAQTSVHSSPSPSAADSDSKCPCDSGSVASAIPPPSQRSLRESCPWSPPRTWVSHWSRRRSLQCRAGVGRWWGLGRLWWRRGRRGGWWGGPARGHACGAYGRALWWCVGRLAAGVGEGCVRFEVLLLLELRSRSDLLSQQHHFNSLYHHPNQHVTTNRVHH